MHVEMKGKQDRSRCPKHHIRVKVGDEMRVYLICVCISSTCRTTFRYKLGTVSIGHAKLKAIFNPVYMWESRWECTRVFILHFMWGVCSRAGIKEILFNINSVMS